MAFLQNFTRSYEKTLLQCSLLERFMNYMYSYKLALSKNLALCLVVLLAMQHMVKKETICTLFGSKGSQGNDDCGTVTLSYWGKDSMWWASMAELAIWVKYFVTGRQQVTMIEQKPIWRLQNLQLFCSHWIRCWLINLGQKKGIFGKAWEY